MKKTDRFLITIVVSIAILVIVTLVLTLRQPAATYQPENSPTGVAHNYLLALQQKDYERAHGYLSTTLPGYPANSQEFEQHITRYSWSFRFDENTAVSITDATISDERATVHAVSSQFYSEGLFGSGVSSSNFDLQLRHKNGEWKIVQADRYWANCWSQSNGCR